MPPAEPGDRASAAGAEPLPVSRDTVMRMASLYLARYSASTVRLRQVLLRKVERRCTSRGVEPPDEAALGALIDEVVDRLRRAELIDDAAYGRSRAVTLARKGWPGWRIKADLERQGIDAELRGMSEALQVDEAAQATRLAERLRLGPFRRGDRAPDRDRDIARLARAGFSVAVARAVIDRPS